MISVDYQPMQLVIFNQLQFLVTLLSVNCLHLLTMISYEALSFPKEVKYRTLCPRLCLVDRLHGSSVQSDLLHC